MDGDDRVPHLAVTGLQRVALSRLSSAPASYELVMEQALNRDWEGFRDKGEGRGRRAAPPARAQSQMRESRRWSRSHLRRPVPAVGISLRYRRAREDAPDGQIGLTSVFMSCSRGVSEFHQCLSRFHALLFKQARASGDEALPRRPLPRTSPRQIVACERGNCHGQNLSGSSSGMNGHVSSVYTSLQSSSPDRVCTLNGRLRLS